jgi:hypothetical protein
MESMERESSTGALEDPEVRLVFNPRLPFMAAYVAGLGAVVVAIGMGSSGPSSVRSIISLSCWLFATGNALFDVSVWFDLADVAGFCCTDEEGWLPE